MDSLIAGAIGASITSAFAFFSKFGDNFFARKKLRMDLSEKFFDHRLEVLTSYVSYLTLVSGAYYNELQSMRAIDIEHPESTFLSQHLMQSVQADMAKTTQLKDLYSAAALFIQPSDNIPKAIDELHYRLRKMQESGNSWSNSINTDAANGAMASYKATIDSVLEQYSLAYQTLQDEISAVRISFAKVAQV